MSPTDMSRMIIADVVARWPVTVHVFNARRMACPGCAMAPFMTVADAASSYLVDTADLAAALYAATLSPGPTGAARGRSVYGT